MWKSRQANIANRRKERAIKKSKQIIEGHTICKQTSHHHWGHVLNMQRATHEALKAMTHSSYDKERNKTEIYARW